MLIRKMTLEDCTFKIFSTWTANEESITIKDIISLEDIHNSEWMHLSEEDIRQLGQLNEDGNSPVELIRPNTNEHCKLTIELEDPYTRIAKLMVISEAKIIEFYGKHGEYICTEKAHFLGNIAGKKFYIAQPNTLETKEITFKFHESGETFWLYGITLFVTHYIRPPYNSIIDYSNVDQILNNSNIHLTENAERAKSFITNYNSTKMNNGTCDKDTLQNLLQKWNTLGLSTKPFSNLLLTTPSPTDENHDNIISANGNKEKDFDSNLKNYVDIKLKELEERVQNNLQTQIKEFEQKQNEKLDNIIQLLQKKL